MIKLCLYVECVKCRADIAFSSWDSTRPELAKESEFIELCCKSCSKRSNYHVNTIRAEKNKLLLIIAFAILLLGMISIAYLFLTYVLKSSVLFMVLDVGGFFLVPISIYSLIHKEEENRVLDFNRYKI